MKALLTALLVSAAIPAFCQNTPQLFPQPNQLFPSPQQFQYFPPATQPQIFTFNGNLNSIPLPQLVPPSKAPQLLDPHLDPHLDAQIIHRPPQDAVARQQTRTPLAGNLYPGLKILPIETAHLEPVPVYFPKFKMEPIPITWPNAKITLLQAAPAIAPKK